jgi:hypothetical protein
MGFSIRDVKGQGYHSQSEPMFKEMESEILSRSRREKCERRQMADIVW